MRKAQLASLDLLIAIAIAILGLGLLFQFSETGTYWQKERQFQKELEGIGKTASAMLVGNPKIKCELTDNAGTTIGFLENCIDTAKINATALAIPNKYDFRVFNETDNAFVAGTATIPAQAKNVFSEKRIVALHSGNLRKEDLEKCMGNVPGQTCGTILEQKEFSIAVWRQIP